jgi:ADP-heptose:LPS heptosyltransferase
MMSPRIEALRRRLTARLMRGAYRVSRGGDTPLPHDGIRQILVCRAVHTLGDALTVTPLLEELDVVYPDAAVDVVTGHPDADALYGSFPGVRSIFRLPPHALRHPRRTLRTLGDIRRAHYDLAIDADPRSQSGRLLALRARATHVLGYIGPPKSGLVTCGAPVADAPRHHAMSAVHLLRAALGHVGCTRPYPQPGLRLAPDELDHGRQVALRVTGSAGDGNAMRCIGLFANATGEKKLNRDWWHRFLDALEPRVPGYRFIEILPAPGQSLLDGRYPGFHSRDVRKLAAMIANLSLHVSADCGVMHLAWASGAPTLGLFKVTDSAEWGPFGGLNRSMSVRDAAPGQIALDVADHVRHCGDAPAPAGRPPLQRTA